jgi:hypothetical protein
LREAHPIVSTGVENSPVTTSYRIAVLCGALPLAVGTLTFAAWILARAPWLMLAGLYTIICGLVLFLIGSSALAYYYRHAKSQTDLRRVRIATIACGLLLLANFPVAAAITLAAVSIETRYVVVIHNHSQQPLRDARLIGGGCDSPLGTIPPGAAVTRSLWFHRDGELQLVATYQGSPRLETVEGYVTSGAGGQARVTLNEAGKLHVDHPRAGYLSE